MLAAWVAKRAIRRVDPAVQPLPTMASPPWVRSVQIPSVAVIRPLETLRMSLAGRTGPYRPGERSSVVWTARTSAETSSFAGRSSPSSTKIDRPTGSSVGPAAVTAFLGAFLKVTSGAIEILADYP